MTIFKKYVMVACTFLTIASVFLVLPAKTRAAGVAVSITTVSNAAVSTATAPVITFTSSVAYVVGDTVTLTYASPNAYTDTGLLNTNFTLTGTGTFTTSIVVNTTTDTVTFTVGTGSITAGPITITTTGANLITPSTAGNYDFVINTSKGDYGAALQYVGTGFLVTVSATVLPIITFAIRNSLDTADANACALGILTTTAVASCSYRLKVATNAISGYTVSLISDGDLRLSGTGNVSDTLDIDTIAENGTITAGTEGYGITLLGGSVTSSAAVTESGDFNDDDTPLPSTLMSLYTSAGGNSPTATDTTNTALVTHEAAIDASTTGGIYSQIVVYSVTSTF